MVAILDRLEANLRNVVPLSSANVRLRVRGVRIGR